MAVDEAANRILSPSQEAKVDCGLNPVGHSRDIARNQLSLPKRQIRSS
jgi:hypothetical protein